VSCGLNEFHRRVRVLAASSECLRWLQSHAKDSAAPFPGLGTVLLVHGMATNQTSTKEQGQWT
jgi:hypothetical protein